MVRCDWTDDQAEELLLIFEDITKGLRPTEQLSDQIALIRINGLAHVLRQAIANHQTPHAEPEPIAEPPAEIPSFLAAMIEKSSPRRSPTVGKRTGTWQPEEDDVLQPWLYVTGRRPYREIQKLLPPGRNVAMISGRIERLRDRAEREAKKAAAFALDTHAEPDSEPTTVPAEDAAPGAVVLDDVALDAIVASDAPQAAASTDAAPQQPTETPIEAVLIKDEVAAGPTSGEVNSVPEKQIARSISITEWNPHPIMARIDQLRGGR